MWKHLKLGTELLKDDPVFAFLRTLWISLRFEGLSEVIISGRVSKLWPLACFYVGPRVNGFDISKW